MGKGGYPWEDAYRMPVRVRKLNVMKLKELLDAEAAAYKGKGGGNNKDSMNKAEMVALGKRYKDMEGKSRVPSKSLSPTVTRPNTAPKQK